MVEVVPVSQGVQILSFHPVLNPIVASPELDSQIQNNMGQIAQQQLAASQTATKSGAQSYPAHVNISK